MKTEKIFEFGGEGGGISISRQKSKSQEIFIYHHSEFDPTDEGLGINKKITYTNFDQPFQLINASYPWYKLCLLSVHEDVKDYVIAELIKKLNEESVQPDHLYHTKYELEIILRIELIVEMKDNKPFWSFKHHAGASQRRNRSSQ